LWGLKHWDARAASVAAWIDELQPDLVALQEVWQVDGGTGQADWLADQVGMTAHFGAAFSRDDRHYGNAVLSRAPVLAERTTTLSERVGTREPRVMVSVQVAVGPGSMWFSATHLSHRPREGAVREEQVVTIADALDSLGGTTAAILCGDMNATAETAEVRFLTGQASLGGRRCELTDAFRAAHPHDPGITWSHTNPNVGGSARRDRRIDFILVGAAHRVASAAVVGDEARAGAWPSDHFGVLADLADPRLG
jgi:endonuclease/exonuclease/phosphatase family metal-dependent hydrolase